MSEVNARQSTAVLDVSVALILQRDRVLVSRRKAGVHQGGRWEFPGGKLEPGETSRQALHREVLEEVGVPVRIEESLDPVRHAYPDRTVLLHPFVCTPLAPVPEREDRRWVDRDAIGHLSFPEANAPLLRWITDHG